VPAVLAAYNWAPNTERYRKRRSSSTRSSQNFRRSRTRHSIPNGRKVSLSAPLQDWNRLPSAEQWLKPTTSKRRRAPGSTNS
jgi:hypothetical protein